MNKHEQLSRVVIKGYKSILNCDLPIGNINVLIGSNGAGKSNFVSVFTWLQSILRHEMNLYASRKGLPTLFYDGNKTTNAIQMEFWFGDDCYSFELEMTEINSLIFRTERFGDKSISYNGHKETKWGVPTFTPDSFGSMYDILKKYSLRTYHFHDTSATSKMKAVHNISNCKAFLHDASNLAAFLFHLRKHYTAEYSKILETVQLVAPYFKDFELEPLKSNQEQIALRWQQKGCEDIFYASQLSDGTLRFICLATLLLQPKELQPSTIIIDEPELGLHPFAITIFAELVKKAAVNKQLILATQSAELLNNFTADDVVVVDRDVNGSEFKRLETAELAEWLEDDYTLGELWNKNIFGGRFAQ